MIETILTKALRPPVFFVGHYPHGDDLAQLELIEEA
jgi:hypothetical protein